jgi:prepilin-type N-terminal cleavage/methylation domain-containing protein
MPALYNNRGFTLIEIMITITIIAVTFGVIITSAASVRKSGRDGQRQSDLLTIRAALQQFYADQNYFPDSVTLTAGDPITNCPTVPASGCTPTKTYLDRTPITPSGTSYYYRSGVDSTTANKYNNCGGGSSGTCHFFLLCASLEGTSPQSASQYADCATFNPAFNYQLNP